MKSSLPSTMTASDARTNFYDIAEEASKNSRRFTVSLHGKPSVVIMSLEDLDGLEETIEIMSDPELVESIKRGEEDIKAGRVYTLDEVIKDLKLNESRVQRRSEKTVRKTSTTGTEKSLQKSSGTRAFCFGR